MPLEDGIAPRQRRSARRADRLCQRTVWTSIPHLDEGSPRAMMRSRAREQQTVRSGNGRPIGMVEINPGRHAHRAHQKSAEQHDADHVELFNQTNKLALTGLSFGIQRTHQQKMCQAMQAADFKVKNRMPAERSGRVQARLKRGPIAVSSHYTCERENSHRFAGGILR